MSGTRAGGLKAAARNLKNNPNFYKEIGAEGGRNGHQTGFYYKKECNCDLIEGMHTKPMCAGKKGGLKSRRTSKKVLTS